MLREPAGLVLRVDLVTVDRHVEDAAIALDEFHVDAEAVAQPILDGGRQTGGLREIVSAHAVLNGDMHRILVARGDSRQWSAGVAIRRGPDFDQLEQLRQSIIKKNRLHFYGFRPQNKAYIHLFRRHERGHHAAEVDRFALLVAETEDDITRIAVPKRRIYELFREKNYGDHEVPGGASSADVEAELASFDVPRGVRNQFVRL